MKVKTMVCRKDAPKMIKETVINADFVEVIGTEIRTLVPDLVKDSALPYVRLGDLQAFQERVLNLQELMRMIKSALDETDKETRCYQVVMDQAQKLSASLQGDIRRAKTGEDGYILTEKGYQLYKEIKAAKGGKK